MPAAQLSLASAARNAASLPPATLGLAAPGLRARIVGLRAEGAKASLPAGELERRLIELGFVEGAEVEVLHQGLFGADPIAVRVDGATVALRRREAGAILLAPLA